MNKIINEISLAFRQFEAILPSLINRHPFPPENFAFAINSSENHPATPPKDKFSLKDLIGDGFLFAVPIFRRTLEVRKTRKIGTDYFGDGKSLKILRKRDNILLCDNCGHFHIRNHLCANCYSKVKNETRIIWAKIRDKLRLANMVNDKEVVVLYEGEKEKESDEFWNGHRIVEMEKPRPSFFNKNLLQKTTQPNAVTKEVEQVSTIELKPKNLS